MTMQRSGFALGNAKETGADGLMKSKFIDSKRVS